MRVRENGIAIWSNLTHQPYPHMTDYTANGEPLSAEQFTQHACDPTRSVVVEACAGSGKTWLLVGRIVRALLQGARPGEILAITFTRRAAQEMHSRLLADLEYLAAADTAAVLEFLQLRGMSPEQAQRHAGDARQLYERVVTATVPVTIDTFHGWFWRLVARAPLGVGVPFAPVLLESTDRVRRDAWLHWSAALLQPANTAQRVAWETLVDFVGDQAARKWVEALLSRRAEWWSFAAGDEDAAMTRALAPFADVGEHDPALRVRAPQWVSAMERVLDLFLSIDKPNKTTTAALADLQRWLREPAPSAAADLHAACDVLMTAARTPTVLFTPERMAKHLPTEAHLARYTSLHTALIDTLNTLLRERRVWKARRINEAALVCARGLISHYQHLKEQEQALDFTDLEWLTYRLLADPDHAAYMQARLDARYRHILLDEFQDTNPLQWQVLQSWLASYGAADEAAPQDRPSVFIVGDPKQSIYRFRRAEPRVFAAACALLQQDYGALHLRTNVTRRNSTRVIEALNQVMTGRNALYQPQSTRARAQGEFVLLPLVPMPAPAMEKTPDGPDPMALRDVLTTPRTERDNDSRYREGRVIANELAHALTQVRVSEGGEERAARWSDVLLLVRRRTHLADYERALRDAGVPYVSDRRGGLLTTLEADDLTALLGFLTTPTDDLKLAHALRSPLFGCSDEALMALVQQPGASAWARLNHLVQTHSAESALTRAHALLTRWLAWAGVLPVHDLLDRIYFEGELRTRYAAVVPATLHAQVQANLDAFIELALALDAGRYPSLPRFIDELVHLKKHARDEAPDEGPAHVVDAVRILTIHAAKGLEADIVVLADTHATASGDEETALVVWPPHAARPEHISLVGRGAEALDESRAPWFAQEDAQRAQEDWNLLYVAATRARQVLIVSGVESARSAPQDSGYLRMQAAEALNAGAAPAQVVPRSAMVRTVYDFVPAPCAVGQCTAVSADSTAQRLGQLWHALLEHGPQTDAAELARRFNLSAEHLQEAQAAAQRVRTRLPQWFVPTARAEVELMNEAGELLRVDRLIETPEALWVIDFKWSVPPELRAEYEAQVRRYGEVLRTIYVDKPIRLTLVDALGQATEVACGY